MKLDRIAFVVTRVHTDLVEGRDNDASGKK